MKNIVNKIKDMPYAIAAAATVALMAEPAQAQQKIGDAAESVTTQLGNIGKLIVAGSFIGGLVMFGTGLMKLKQASENPQTKYSEGLWRVAVGAGLVAIPTFSGMLTQTFSLGSPKSITEGGGATF